MSRYSLSACTALPVVLLAVVSAASLPAQRDTISSQATNAAQGDAAPAGDIPRIELPANLLAFAVTGGVVQLEMDRMTGTSFPTSQTVPGKTVDLQSIYLDGGGVVLLVTEDETDIPPVTELFQGMRLTRRGITAAELDNLAKAHRHVPVGPISIECAAAGLQGASACTQYFLYGVVVNHFYAEGDKVDPSVVGLVWDATNRSEFAIFYRHADVRDPGKYLRTTAHEIGHAFNLHHEDGDGHSTIMNQGANVGNTYTFTFSAGEQAHLRNHLPQRCSRPGVGSSRSVDASHTPHRDITQDCR
jgi:hypothetical protein